jgi:hypothetical protein
MKEEQKPAGMISVSRIITSMAEILPYLVYVQGNFFLVRKGL